MSSRFLKHYEVVKNQVLGPATGPGFSSASGETIHPTSLVCLKAFFRLTSREDPSDTMLKECLVSAFVADVPNNVLSVGSLLRKGWSLSSSGSELEVCFGGYNLDLVTWQNVPWIFHEVETVMDFSDDRDLQKTFWSRRKIHDGPVNTVEHLSETDKSMLMTTKRQPDVSLEELDPAAASSSSPAYVSSRPVSDSESPYRHFPFHADCLSCQAAKRGPCPVGHSFVAPMDTGHQTIGGAEVPASLKKDCISRFEKVRRLSGKQKPPPGEPTATEAMELDLVGRPIHEPGHQCCIHGFSARP